MADKRKFVPNVSFGTPRLDMAGLRHLAESEPKAFMGRVQGLIDEGKLSWSDVRDLKGLFFALADIQVPALVDVMGQQREIMASAFPLLTGGLTVAAVNAAYEAVPTIGQELVQEKIGRASCRERV